MTLHRHVPSLQEEEDLRGDFWVERLQCKQSGWMQREMDERRENLGAGGTAQVVAAMSFDFNSDRRVLDPTEERVNNS